MGKGRLRFLCYFGLCQLAFGSTVVQMPVEVLPAVQGDGSLTDAQLQGLVYYNEAAALYQSKSPDALGKLEMALASYADCEPCLELMVYLRCDQNQTDEALAAYDKLAEVSKSPQQLQQALMRIGVMYYNLGDLARAELVYIEAFTISGNTLNDCRYYLGLIFKERGELEKAYSTLKFYMENGPIAGTEEKTKLAIKDLEQKIEWSQGLFGELDIEGLDGKKLDFRNYRGKIVLVDVWATWCGPCRESSLALKQLAKTYAGRPFELVSISVDKKMEPVSKYVRRNGHTWPQFWDKNHISAGFFGQKAIPRFVLLDATGRQFADRTGWGKNTDMELYALVKDAVTALEKNSNPPTETTAN